MFSKIGIALVKKIECSLKGSVKGKCKIGKCKIALLKDAHSGQTSISGNH